MDQSPHPGPQAGLYDPRDERDSCGFGLIAQLDDVPSRALVQRAIDALVRMTHRGGIAADGLSGDGCGVLIRKPDAWLRALASEARIALGTLYAAGLVFLPHDDAAAARVRDTVALALREVQLAVAGWRVVPVDITACGERARASMPRIEQLFVVPVLDIDGARPTPERFQHALYLARRRAEQRLRDVAAAVHEDAYVVTLSAHAIGYKGMVLPNRLAQLYPDLQRAELSSSAVVFHQRFSTNSAPRWPLAQPFRLLAHNGEINTISGNRAWAQARVHAWRTPASAELQLDPREFNPVIGTDGSDSQSLDNMLELLQAGGMDLLKAMRILIPPATQSLEYKDADLAAFYDYYAINSEPWDGPAGIVTTDARFAACTLDRNGLRPARWVKTSDRHFMIASEAGVFDIAEAEVEAKGKLGPGEMIAADLQSGVLLDSEAIDAINRARAPYKLWLKQGMTYLHSELIDPSLAAEPFDHETLARYQKLFQLTREEREQVLRPLAETEQEAIGSMGDDVPMAVLSEHVRPLYDCFRQAFAQVTNPPIDPLREDCVMSLVTQLGPEGNIFEDSADAVHHVMLNSPVLSQRKLRQVLSMQPFATAHRVVDLNFSVEEGLEAALRRICVEAEEAVRDGVIFLLLSDRYPQRDKQMLHALLATGAVHQHLIRVGLRCKANLVVETGTARDPHHFACLIGFGATAVYPYLAYQTLHDLGVRGILKTKHGEVAQIGRSYRRGVKKGLLKIISKMGISTIGSYRGAQLFEIIGLDREVVDLCFTGTAARVGGAGFAALQADAEHLAAHAWNANALPEIGGLLKYVPGGEYHLFNPDVVTRLQRAVATGDWQDWQHYAAAVNERPTAALRDLLHLRVAATPIPVDEVEPVAAIVRRFDTAAMSLGALSPEAHEALAIAMNRLGGRSNSGEGGEDPARYGSDKVSKIKQIASGRFGVTPEYLVNAEVLQIKIAQGAKPGEGGQLPGHKVNALIARLRYAMPGIGLISPPPHHDIYSIEDLAQLIYDLRQVNPDALVSVKLVSHAGVGTIATGVVKAGADLVTISGHDGGTGASPLSSIRYAGTPWELGLAETRQALLANGLRERVIVQADGGMKSGLDVVKAALLGAESFGFGTAPMIALGCKYLRICHLNNCATGVATQDDALRRDHFTGLPERVENFFRLMAEEVRQWLAQLGVRSLGEVVGRTDLLQPVDRGNAADASWRQRRLDLAPLLASNGLAQGGHCGVPAPAPVATGLAARLDVELADAIANKRGGEFDYAIRNTDRSIGARLSGQIARAHGDRGMDNAPLTVRFRGVAGQSFGAFHAGGLHFHLAGEANDYVGKGMAGGRIVLRPSSEARYVTRDAPILGNTCLYGATGGELYASGRAGERFAVRNSGAIAVVEGAGDHCCEYMTGGVVAVLGRTGLNFGAGFTGGLAYVLDLDRDFVDHYNHELIDILRIAGDGMENYRSHLRDLLLAHVEHTGSVWAQRIVDEMRDFLGKFWLVKPKAASLEALAENLRRAA